MNAILFNSNDPSVQATQMLKEAEQIIKNSSPKENRPKSKKSIIIIICLIVFIILFIFFFFFNGFRFFFPFTIFSF